MIPRLAIIAFSLLATFTQAAMASREDDARYIASQIITDEFQISAHNKYVGQVTQSLGRALAKQSVEIVDKDEFFNLLEPHIQGPSRAKLEQIAVDVLLRQVKPGQMAELADFVREMPSGTGSHETDTSNANAAPEEPAERVTAAIDGSSMRKGMGLAAVLLSVLLRASTDTQDIEANVKAPYMADIFATNGVFRFPNRIIRQNYIRESRAANP